MLPQIKRKPKLAVWKFASCSGCQLSLLDCEDDLLSVAGAVEIANLPEVSRTMAKGPYDISLVEGSITTPAALEHVQEVRHNSKYVVTIGACAMSGGIQALRNFKDVHEFTRIVYAQPEYISTLEKSTPISDHIKVDYELAGCPVSKEQLIEVISALITGRTPEIPTSSLCLECKRLGVVCVMSAHGTPCLGPVTRSGCGALCPSYNRGCYGCYGPKERANTASLSKHWSQLGATEEQIVRVFRGCNANAAPFKKESEAHEHH